MTLPTTADFNNAKRDLDDLAEIVTSPTVKDVPKRLGGNTPTLSKVMSETTDFLATQTQRLADRDAEIDQTLVRLRDHAPVRNRGAWITGTTYEVNDIWQAASDVWYVVVEEYVAGATDVADIASGKVFVHQVSIVADMPADTIADLRLFQPSQDGQHKNVTGHTVAGVGGGAFYYDAGDTTSPDNNGTVIVNEWGDRWKREYKEFITPEDFGGGVGGDDTASLAALSDLKARISGSYTSEPLTVNNGHWFGDGSILIIKPSLTLEFSAITITGSGSVRGFTVQGGVNAASSLDSRTYRAVSITQSANGFRVTDLKALYFKVAGVETTGIGASVPSNGKIQRVKVDGGDIGILNGVVVKGGKNIEVSECEVINAFNQCYTVSDASRLTPINEYAQNYDIRIHDNYGEMIDPPASIAANIDAAIKLGGGLRNKAYNNNIVYKGAKTHLSGAIGKCLEIKLYDLAQQLARNDGSLGNNEGVAFPFNELHALPEAYNNTFYGFSIGLFLNGIYAACAHGNTFAVTKTGVMIDSQGATIQGTPYAMPSFEGNTNTRANIYDNRLISLDTRAKGAGNTFEGFEYKTNYNRVVNTEYLGIVNNRHGGTNLGVQNFRSDLDGRTFGVSDKVKGDLTNDVVIQAGFTSQVVSGSLQQGGLSKIDLSYEGAVTDYTVSGEPSWDTTWWVTDKTNKSFKLNFGTAPTGNLPFRWAITLSSSELG